MKLTAAIAMSYPNSKVTMSGYDDPIFKIDEIDFKHDEFTLMRVSNGDIFHEPIGKCQLLLTPLSKISDEDAVEVAKIIDRNSTFSGEVTYQFKLVDAYDYKTNTDYKAPCVQRLVNGNECGLEIIGEHLLNSIILIDYLRSKEYDCGHGLIPSLIAAGVAVEKKEI